MTKIGIAGLDHPTHVRQVQAGLGIAGDGSGDRQAAASAAIADVGIVTDVRDDCQGAAKVGISGIKDRSVLVGARAGVTGVGIAGVNRASVLEGARAGVTGNLTSTVRQAVDQATDGLGPDRWHLGDRAAAVGAQYGVYFIDYTYAICTDDNGAGERLRWRRGRQQIFGGARTLPVILDSTAYRRHTGTAPRWASVDTYLAAIEMVQPDGFAAYDTFGDQAASVRDFDAMCAMGFGPDRGCFPVYHVLPRWRADAIVTAPAWSNIPAAARCAVANARIAASDPVMRYYAGKSLLIGLGGMVRGPIPRDVRHYYFAELCRLLPDHQFWGLGQANFKVVNGLGAMGLLDRVWTDGTWYILDAACERFAVVQDGRIKMLSLEGSMSSFFTIVEMMAANLRSLLAAYAGLWTWPPPDPLPLDSDDAAQVVELHRRVRQGRMELFGDGDVSLVGNVPVRLEE